MKNAAIAKFKTRKTPRHVCLQNAHIYDNTMMEAETVGIVMIIKFQLKTSGVVQNHLVINMKGSQKEAHAKDVVGGPNLIQRIQRNVYRSNVLQNTINGVKMD